jgi:hypothetical protein
MEEVGRLMTQLLGEPEATAVAARSTTGSQTDKAKELIGASNLPAEIQPIPGSTTLAPAADQRSRQLDTANAANSVTQRGNASRHESLSSGNDPPTPRRGHGGALPKFQ